MVGRVEHIEGDDGGKGVRVRGVEERVRLAREEIRADEKLPEWPPTQWVNALAVKLGDSAYHAGQFGRDHQIQFCEQMIAVAAVAMDAVEALEAG